MFGESLLLQVVVLNLFMATGSPLVSWCVGSFLVSFGSSLVSFSLLCVC